MNNYNTSVFPPDVVIRSQARKPIKDPTLGIPVEVSRSGQPRHRLVTIGSSLTQGFQNGAIFNTHLSYPMLIARELGWSGEFRYPKYNGPGEGLPLNLETLARKLEKKFPVGKRINLLNYVLISPGLIKYLDASKDYWERRATNSREIVNTGLINHNLAVYGWDLRNIISRNADICIDMLEEHPPKNNFLRLMIHNHNERASIPVLHSARDAEGTALSQLEAAAVLGAEGTEETEGIETLIILIGANNALGSVLTFSLVWTDVDYDNMEVNDQYTIWRPIHFKVELDQLVAEIKKIRARHVILATVPHITIVPFLNAVGNKVREDSRYFPYYTLPWLNNKNFNPRKHPHITENEARVIDSVIDHYNDFIVDAVRQARGEGRDWYVFELCGLLDRLASKRYLKDHKARPDWWTPYELPTPLQALSPVPDSRFFISGPNGRTSGGLFSLDGIHPTTIGYGILAQELIKIMEIAGVKFFDKNGNLRARPIEIDFERLIQEDSLISIPPTTVEAIFDFLGRLIV